MSDFAALPLAERLAILRQAQETQPLDPRVVEYRRARDDARRGLSAPPGARKRYREAIGPYLMHEAERTPPEQRGAMMQALFGAGLPLGMIAIAFKASEDEVEQIATSQPPIQPEPVDEADRLHRLPYKAYLRSEHWQAVREQALQRADHRCQLCNSTERLEVHHRTYRRRGSERPADVIALCEQCHGAHHNRLKAA